MGDRITTYLPCPKCGKETEQYDASSSLIWSWDCESCSWQDDHSYYETGENEISLLTKEQASEKGFCVSCGMHQVAAMKSIDYPRYWKAVSEKQSDESSAPSEPQILTTSPQ